MSVSSIHSPHCGRPAPSRREEFGVRGACSSFLTHHPTPKRQKAAAPCIELGRTWTPSGCAKSSVRSAMFIATPASEAAKLRRSGMCLRLPGYGGPSRLCRSYGAWLSLRELPAPINMALLTELARLRCRKTRVRCRANWPHSKRFARRHAGKWGSDLC
jgi:hypothetical protein